MITLQGKIHNSKAFSTYNTRIDFSFLVKSKTGFVYSKKNYSINGVSVTDYQRAYESSVNKLLTVVEDRSDIYNLLGFGK